MMYKTLFSLILIVFTVSFIKAEQWESFEVAPWLINGTISTIDFVDANTGCVGAYGIFRTSNAGQNWVQVLNGVVVYDIQFFGQIGFASGASGTGVILKTIDGGQNWSYVYTNFPYGTPFGRITIVNANTVLVTSANGSDKRLLVSTDAGNSWEIVLTSEDPTDFVSSLRSGIATYVASGDKLYIDEGSGFIDRQNGGLHCYSSIGISYGNVFIGGQKDSKAAINSTSDNGLTWNTVVLNSSDNGICKELELTGSTGYAVGYQSVSNAVVGKIYKTADGISWQEIYNLPSKEFWDLCNSERYVYFVGKGANVLRYEPGLIGIEPGHGNIPDNFLLEQNYPNPFNPETKINFSIPKRSNISIRVYDISGKEIHVLADGEMNAGQHSVSFNGSNLSSGLYFYVLKSEGIIETKKMMLIK